MSRVRPARSVARGVSTLTRLEFDRRLSMEITLVVWEGLITGILGQLWRVYTHVTNRGRLRVNAAVVQHRDLGMNLTNIQIWCSVINVGRQPLIVIEVGIDYERASRSWAGGKSKLPARLAPGEWRRVVFEHDTEALGYLKTVWARDSYGHMYRMSRRETKKLRESATASPKVQAG